MLPDRDLAIGAVRKSALVTLSTKCRSWGAGTLIMPHSIGVNPADGAIWVTDVGLHQALRFDEHGKQLLAIGQRLQPGHDAAHLCKPTAVSVLSLGCTSPATAWHSK